MVDLYELKQLTAFADLGTLHRVAEEFHLSTPSITRSMQHLEQYFGVPLFTRGKNRIELNETGKLAVAARASCCRKRSWPSRRSARLTSGSGPSSSAPARPRLCGSCCGS